MSELTYELQRCIRDMLEADKMIPEIFTGSVTSTAPLTVKIDQKLMPSGDNLIVLQEVVKDTPFAAGNNVVLLRCPGGQRFVILGRQA